MIQNIDHVNLVVDDLETMTAFYRDVLGMTVTKQCVIRGDWIEDVVGIAGVVGHVVYLDLPDGPRIELIRYEHPPAQRPGGMGIANTPGIRHIAFKVTDLDATFASLKQGGAAFLGEPQQVPDAQVTYAGGVRKRLVYFRDPEGNILELCEYS